METKKNKKVVNLNYFNYKECKEWLSEIDFWKEGIEFMERLIKKSAASLSDEDHILRLRNIHNELTGTLLTDIEHLKGQLEVYKAEHESRLLETPSLDTLTNYTKLKQLQHDLYTAQQLYEDLRTSLFDLIKETRKERNKQHQVA